MNKTGFRPNIFYPQLEGEASLSEITEFLQAGVLEEPVVEVIEPESEPPEISGDFITDYVSYADVIEAPPEAHEAVAISLLAAVMNGKVSIKHGELEVPLDLWVLLLSSSGFGRNTLVGLSKPILENSGVNIVRNEMWGSRESVFQNFAQEPSGLFLWPELSSVMKMLSDSRYGGVKEWITDRYDNWDIPSSIRYRKTGKGSDTPSIEFFQAPRINLLATSSVDWFVSCLDQDDTTGGFIPRWLMVKLPDPKRLIPKPKPTDKRFVDPLATHLGLASLLEGAADFSCVEGLYSDWYSRAHERFSAQQNRGLAMPFYNRQRGQVLKLAVVYEVSKSLSLKVSPEAMSRAIDFASRVEQTIFELLLTGMSREGAEVDKMAARIKAMGAEGLPQSDLTTAFQHVRRADREARIQTLIESGAIQPFHKATPGRSATIYVHRDYVAEHVRRFPGERLVE